MREGVTTDCWRKNRRRSRLVFFDFHV